MCKFIILSLVSLAVLPAHANLKTKLAEIAVKRKTNIPVTTRSGEIVNLPIEKQIDSIFYRLHLDPRVKNSGSMSRIVRDSFADGSNIDANLKVDYFQKRRVTFLETKLEGVDVNNSILKNFAKDAQSIKKTRDGSVYVKHIIPDDGITDDLSLRFSEYYKSLLKKDYYDSKKVMVERYRQLQQHNSSRQQGLR